MKCTRCYKDVEEITTHQLCWTCEEQLKIMIQDLVEFRNKARCPHCDGHYLVFIPEHKTSAEHWACPLCDSTYGDIEIKVL